MTNNVNTWAVEYYSYTDKYLDTIHGDGGSRNRHSEPIDSLTS